MPTTMMKVKSGNKYPIRYRISGSLSTMTREQLEVLALRQLRSSARNYILGKLNEVEPAIVSNQQFARALKEENIAASDEQILAFFQKQNRPLEVPTEFEIDLSELLPDMESKRGKKAADIFSMDEAEEEEEEEE